MPHQILRPKEAARRLGVGHSKFYELVNEKKLRLVKIGDRAVGVVESELDDFIDSLPTRDAAAVS